MGKITRDELAPSLQQEMDEVYNYIKGSINEAVGNHMADKNNPHAVTKVQVGLGNVSNVLQASKSEFDAHAGNRNNPHGVTTAQIGAVPTSRSVHTGDGLVGGGLLSGNLVINVNYNTLDGRYLGRWGTATNADRFGGLGIGSFFKHGDSFANMGNSGGVGYAPHWNNVYFRIGGYDYEAYHSGRIKSGTANPSGGRDGDIYIQY